MVLKDYGSGKERVCLQHTSKVDKQTIGDIYIESKINDVYNQLNNINQIFIVGTAISLFITVILGFFIARTITKPLPTCVTKPSRCLRVTTPNA